MPEKKIKWDETSIRRELAKLDAKTGLHGADLPIRFSKSRSTLGSFSCDENERESFMFSNYYFQNPEWPEEEALDTIWHEYAHYMDYELYGNSGHGSTWKMCCMQIGAMPIRCYMKERAYYYQKKHKEERVLSNRLDFYRKGTAIEHPNYGTGVIVKIEGEGIRRTVTVDFKAEGIKKLGLEWVEKNCRRIDDSEES